MSSLTYRSRLKKDLWSNLFRTQGPNMRQAQSGIRVKYYRTNPQSVPFLRPNWSIRKPIHPPSRHQDLWEKLEEFEPAFVTADTLHTCSESIIELDRMHTVKQEPGFSGKRLRFCDEIGLSLECSYNKVFFLYGDRAPYALGKNQNSEQGNPGSNLNQQCT